MIDDVPELATGTVTFLFTDIEGSTRLLQELGDGYADALAEHRRLLRAAFGRHGGVEVDTQGDAFFVAFARAADAVAAETGLGPLPYERRLEEKTLALARSSGIEVEVLRQQGSAMTLDQAEEYAFALVD
jgi:class 3 adenylate cyclase